MFLAGMALSGCAAEQVPGEMPLVYDENGTEITGEIRDDIHEALEYAESRYPNFTCGVSRIMIVPEEDIHDHCGHEGIEVGGCFTPRTNEVVIQKDVAERINTDPDSRGTLYHEFAHSAQYKDRKECKQDMGYEEFQKRFEDLPYHGEFTPQEGVEYDTDECLGFYACKNPQEAHAEWVGYYLANPFMLLGDSDYHAQLDLAEETFSKIPEIEVRSTTLEDETIWNWSFRNVFTEIEGRLAVIGFDYWKYLTVTDSEGEIDSFELEETINPLNNEIFETEQGVLYFEGDYESGELDVKEINLDNAGISSLGALDWFQYYPYDDEYYPSEVLEVHEVDGKIMFFPHLIQDVHGDLKIPYIDRESGDVGHIEIEGLSSESSSEVLSYSNVENGKICVENRNKLYIVDLLKGELVKEGMNLWPNAGITSMSLMENGDIFVTGDIGLVGEYDLMMYVNDQSYMPKLAVTDEIDRYGWASTSSKNVVIDGKMYYGELIWTADYSDVLGIKPTLVERIDEDEL